MPEYLSPEQQRQLFENRGIGFPPNNHFEDANKIQEIGYYRLKELVKPFNISQDNDVKYGRIIYKDGKRQYISLRFKQLIDRYYYDKNLRIFVLHAIEDIEVNLANKVSSLLGNKYGPFGYLNFKLWIDRNIPKFEVEKKQFYFKKDLLKKTKRSAIEDLKGKRNKNSEGFPTVWLMVNLLTLGNMVHLINDMSINNQKIIANKYKCSIEELKNWMECLNLIRNICAHNSNLVDVRLKTKPIPPECFKKCITVYKQHYSNSLAIILFIIKYLMINVNPKYQFGNIYDTVNKLILSDDKTDNQIIAKQLGFINVKSIKKIKQKDHFK